VRELLAIRQREIAPRLAGARFGQAHAADDGLLMAQWHMSDDVTLRLVANLSSNEIANNPADMTGTPIWGGDPGNRLPPWSVYWRLGG
jgi:maltooligosyltrehalose trehalohydrolase